MSGFYEENKLSLSKLVRINSTDALNTTGSKSDFRVNLGQDIGSERVRRILVKSVSFPHVFYNVNANNQTFTFLDDATPRSVVIAQGWYSVAEYLPLLKAAIDLVLTSGSVAITLQDYSTKVQWVFTGTAGDITLYPKATNPAGNLLGITADLIANAGNTYTVVAQSIPRFYGIRECFLEIKELATGNLIDPLTSTKSVLTNIPFGDTPFLGVVNYEAQHPAFSQVYLQTRRAFRELSIRLIDREGAVVDLGNHNLRMILVFYYDLV